MPSSMAYGLVERTRHGVQCVAAAQLVRAWVRCQRRLYTSLESFPGKFCDDIPKSPRERARTLKFFPVSCQA